jgi:CheY-like chemotaxis protein
MNEKILVIEDNLEIRENTAELLALNNYEVLQAENGSAGFLLAKEFKPDLILCDLMMPETDGYKFLKLADEDLIVQNIPLIFFSAGSLPIELQKIQRRADGYLMKPFSENQLIKAIELGLCKVKSKH